MNNEQTNNGVIDDETKLVWQSDPTHRSIVMFLAAEMARKEGRVLARIVVRTKRPQSKMEDIIDWDHETFHERFELKNIDLTVREILRIANQYAENTPLGFGQKAHRFTVHADRYLSGTNMMPFTIVPDNSELATGHSDDAPYEASAQGMVAQATQHTENMHRMFVGYAQTTHVQMSASFKTVLEENRKLNEELRVTRQERDEAQSNKELRELQMLYEGKASERKDKIVAKIVPAIPILINRIAGKQLMPGAMDATQALIVDLVKSLTNEQVQHIAKGLTGPQQFQLMELFKTAAAAAEAQAAAETANQKANGTSESSSSAENKSPNGVSG